MGSWESHIFQHTHTPTEIQIHQVVASQASCIPASLPASFQSSRSCRIRSSWLSMCCCEICKSRSTEWSAWRWRTPRVDSVVPRSLASRCDGAIWGDLYRRLSQQSTQNITELLVGSTRNCFCKCLLGGMFILSPSEPCHQWRTQVQNLDARVCNNEDI